jgi:hypothetical protein
MGGKRGVGVGPWVSEKETEVAEEVGLQQVV